MGSALLGSILAVTALCATGVFGSSLNHLTTTPSLYGQPFDAWFSPENLSSQAQATAMVAAIEAQPTVTAITAGISGDITVNGTTVDALAGQALRGSLLLTTSDGRLPTAADEIALGVSTLRRVHARVGSLVHVVIPLPQGGTRTGPYRVVGATAFPPDFGTGGLGTGAVTTLDGLLGPQCPLGAARLCLPAGGGRSDLRGPPRPGDPGRPRTGHPGPTGPGLPDGGQLSGAAD